MVDLILQGVRGSEDENAARADRDFLGGFRIAADALSLLPDRKAPGFPEVASVFGKAGRAATATDPAPVEMFETIINLRPEDQWRPGVTVDSLTAEMDKALQFPGISNACHHMNPASKPAGRRPAVGSSAWRTPSRGYPRYARAR